MERRKKSVHPGAQRAPVGAAAMGADGAFWVGPPPDGSESAVSELSARTSRRTRASMEQAARRSADWGATVENRRAVGRERIGPEAWIALREHSQQRRSANFGFDTSRPGPVSADEWAEMKRSARAESRELLRKQKISEEVVHGIGAGEPEPPYSMVLDPSARAERLDVVHEEEVPSAVRQKKTNPWFVKEPPYDGWYFNYGFYRSNGTLDVRHNIEGLDLPLAYIGGDFGHRSHFTDDSASNIELMTLETLAEVGFWYKAPSPGKRQIWAKIRCRRLWSAIYLEDEFGWSDSFTDMWSRLRLNVVQVPGLEGQSEDWHVHREGSPDAEWFTLDWIVPDTVLWVPFTANFPAAWVYVAIGAADAHQTGRNDVTTDQTMDTRYRVEQVSIEH